MELLKWMLYFFVEVWKRNQIRSHFITKQKKQFWTSQKEQCHNKMTTKRIGKSLVNWDPTSSSSNQTDIFLKSNMSKNFFFYNSDFRIVGIHASLIFFKKWLFISLESSYCVLTFFMSLCNPSRSWIILSLRWFLGIYLKSFYHKKF